MGVKRSVRNSNAKSTHALRFISGKCDIFFFFFLSF